MKLLKPIEEFINSPQEILETFNYLFIELLPGVEETLRETGDQHHVFPLLAYSHSGALLKTSLQLPLFTALGHSIGALAQHTLIEEMGACANIELSSQILTDDLIVGELDKSFPQTESNTTDGIIVKGIPVIVLTLYYNLDGEIGSLRKVFVAHYTNNDPYQKLESLTLLDPSVLSEDVIDAEYTDTLATSFYTSKVAEGLADLPDDIQENVEHTYSVLRPLLLDAVESLNTAEIAVASAFQDNRVKH